MLIDTHAHLNFNSYRNDDDNVIRRSLDNDTWMINIGSQYETSKKAVEIAEKYPEGVYTAVGVHPIHLAEGIFKVKLDEEEMAFQTKNENFDYEKYKELAQSKKVVAIGEIGLDYYWRPKTKRKLEIFKQKQRTVLCQQLKLAKELNLPVIFHCRQAHQDLIELLSAQPEVNPQKAVAHSFVGNLDQLQKYLDFGFYIGFNGIIFKKIEEIKRNDNKVVILPHSLQSFDFEENIRQTPLEKILIETDCPYLTPPPMTGRNEPIYVKYVAEKISQIKNLNPEEIAKITTENAKNLFQI
ncbi:MAG: TatD family hydrolase [Candidatus Pacebacteria bacterium]|nr:TatD family hydrolase [Candidatus Paceibacterota bacterium]